MNEFSLKLLFSDDGSLEKKTINLIRIFNLFQILFISMFLLIVSFNKFIRLNIIKYLNIIILFFNNIINIIKKKDSNFFLIICLLFFSMQIVSICVKNYKNTSYFDVIKSDDMDAWDFLKITDDSSIYKNYKMLIYGPVYPKISKIIKTLISDPFTLDKYSNERLVSFSINLLNLISVLLICYLISIIFSSRLKDQALFTYILFICFLSNTLWAKYINISRVDIFFSTTVCLIIFIRIRGFIQRSEFLTFLSYFLGGLAYNIKFFYVIFLPGFLVFEILLKKKLTYYISCLIFFLLGFIIFGFPESLFYFEERILLVNKITSLEAGFTLESISYWVKNFIYSFFPMIFIILLISVFTNQKRAIFNIYDFARFFIIIIFPLIYFSKKIWQLNEHYALPITASSFIMISYYLTSSVKFKNFRNKVKKNINLEVLRYILLLSFIIYSYTGYNKYNDISSQIYSSKLINEKNYYYVNELAVGQKILADSYVPYDSSLKNITRQGHLAYTHKLIEKYNPDIVIINTKETEFFLDKKNKPKYSNNSFHQNYQERYVLYDKLYNKKNFNYKKKNWKLIRKDKIIVWQLNKIIN
jgi:hypothetical protein